MLERAAFKRNVGVRGMIQTSLGVALLPVGPVVMYMWAGSALPLVSVVVGVAMGLGLSRVLVREPGRGAKVLQGMWIVMMVGIAVLGAFRQDASTDIDRLVAGLFFVLALYLSAFVGFWGDPTVLRIAPPK